MPRSSKGTRERIVEAANRLFYAEGIRAVSVDAVAELAGVTKKTLYYHFASKDELVAAYLASRDDPNLSLFARWFAAADGPPARKIEAVFLKLAAAARQPKWKGCGFLRTVHELANMPGHPAVRIAAAHKKKVERWLADVLRSARLSEPDRLARQISVLMDGGFAALLVHRDASYLEEAGKVASTLVEAAGRARAKTG